MSQNLPARFGGNGDDGNLPGRRRPAAGPSSPPAQSPKPPAKPPESASPAPRTPPSPPSKAPEPPRTPQPRQARQPEVRQEVTRRVVQTTVVRTEVRPKEQPLFVPPRCPAPPPQPRFEPPKPPRDEKPVPEWEYVETESITSYAVSEPAASVMPVMVRLIALPLRWLAVLVALFILSQLVLALF